MKTFKLKIIILAFGTVFLSSCTKLLYTSLDVLRPAKVAFDSNVNNVLIINNTVPQPADIGHSTQFAFEEQKKEKFNTDSLSIFCLGALKEDIESKNFFASVQLSPNSINTSTDFGSANYISDEAVQALCNSTQSDAIISLDKIKVKDEITEVFDALTNSYVSTLELNFESYWSLHYPNKDEFYAMQFKDTVYWEAESNYRKKGIKVLPKREDALVDGALYVGQKTVNRLVPYWEKVDRYFFNPNKKYFKQAVDSVYVKNWNSAISNWQIVMNQSKSNWTKAQAANNIAIAYEITGNIDKALEYASQAFYNLQELSFADYNSFVRISEYISELTQRRKDIATLKKQLDAK
jgi:tetratricopeptide (TPR) repeat protein